MASFKQLQEAVPAYFHAKMHPKPHLSNYFDFLVNPEQEFSILIPEIRFCSRASKKYLTSYSSILSYPKASSTQFIKFHALFAKYSLRLLLISFMCCGILQSPSGSSGRAVPAYFLAKMHSKLHFSNYFPFLVNPDQEFSI